MLLHLRVFYAREEVWTPTFIIAGITATKLTFAYIAPQIATEPRLVVVLLGAANGLGFMAGAIIGDRLLRRSLGDLQFRKVTKTVLWALGSSLIGALVAWRVDVLLTHFAFPTLANPGFIIRLLIAGVLFPGVTGLILVRAPLPEIQTLVGALSRIPGMSRVLPSRRPLPSDEQPIEEDQPRRLSAQEPGFAVR
nr:lipid II flippase MurJ [Campylobacter jejuni]